jgi:hypothetical protein
LSFYDYVILPSGRMFQSGNKAPELLRTVILSPGVGRRACPELAEGTSRDFSVLIAAGVAPPLKTLTLGRRFIGGVHIFMIAWDPFGKLRGK